MTALVIPFPTAATAQAIPRVIDLPPGHRALRCHLPGPWRPDIETTDRRVVDRIRKAHVDLGPFGFWHDGALITRERFDADRIRMTDVDHLAQFRRALAWLLVCVDRRRDMNRRSTTYGLKHQVEHAIRAIGERGVYVSNGMFIAAALSLDFRVEVIHGTPNAWTDAHPKRERCR